MTDLNTLKSKALTVETAAGAVIGAGIGAVFGGLPGAAVGSVIGSVAAHAGPRRRAGKLTAEQRIIYENAMTGMSSPAHLREMADAFEREGHTVHAGMLRARADSRELPEEIKSARRDAVRACYTSDDADGIDAVAQAYEGYGLLGTAAELRAHAKSVRAAHEAGRIARPLDAETAARFERALVSAIASFGPASGQAKSASTILLRALGKTPDDASVQDMIARAVASAAPTPPAAPSPAPAPFGPEPVATGTQIEQAEAAP